MGASAKKKKSTRARKHRTGSDEPANLNTAKEVISQTVASSEDAQNTSNFGLKDTADTNLPSCSPPLEKEGSQQQQQKQSTTASTKLDVVVHRIRNLDYLPSPIVCLRATPPPLVDDNDNDSSSCSSFVALSRENGTIELKAPNEKFRTIAEIAGYKQKVVNAMTWVYPSTDDDESINHNDTIGRNNDDDINNSDKEGRRGSRGRRRRYSRPTLIGGSRDGTLFVVDFCTGTLTGMTASGGGGVYCLSSLCHNQHSHSHSNSSSHSNKQQKKANTDNDVSSSLVACGCKDGSIRIFKVLRRNINKTTTNNKKYTLELISIIPSASGAAILSVAWRKTATGMILFAGLADGTIRRWDWKPSSSSSSASSSSSNRGTWKSILRMTVENLGRNTPTRVWALQLLSDDTVVSGDSLGHVQFWDGDSGTLTHSFDQNDSKADVLEIAVASNECKIFASGVDSRVVCIERERTNNFPAGAAAAEGTDDQRKWILSQVQRPHTHDVKAMTVCRQRVMQPDTARSSPPGGDANGDDVVAASSSSSTPTNIVELLCTGGIDTKLCTYSVDGFKKLRPRSLYPWPAFSPVAQANNARLLIVRRQGQIDLYKMENTPSEQPLTESFPVSDEESQLGTIELDSPCNLVCATISDDGRFLAACDARTLFVFRLEYDTNSNQGTTMIPTKLSSSEVVTAAPSFVSMKYCGNDKLFAASSDGSIHVIDMPDSSDGNTYSLGMVLKLKQSKVRHKDCLFPVQSIVFTNNKEWFAALQGGLGHSCVRVFAFDNEINQYHPWWALPDLEAPITAVRFLENKDTSSPELVVSCSNFAFYHFDIMGRQLSKFSEDGGVPVSDHLPAELTSRNDYPIRITYNPASPSKILLGSFGAFAIIDLAQKVPSGCRIIPEHHVRRKKRRKQDQKPRNTEGGAESVICLRYNSILHMDFVAHNEMVVVEQPWLNVIATFPAPLERKIYAS